MKRAVFHAPGDVRLMERARPTANGDSVLVAVRACGLCTWEQRVYRGSKRQYPFAGGHEVGGVVVEAPGGEFAPGATVAVSRLPRCRICAACRNGKDNLCAYGTRAMAEPDGPGGLAEYVIASARDIVAVPRSSYAEAALVEPLACVLNSLDVAEVEPATRLAIIGNGFMGVLHARAADAAGADVTLIRTGPTPVGLKRAWPGKSLDADDPTDRPESSAFDAVIVIRDVVAQLTLAGDMACPGGIVSVFASLRPPDDVVGLPASVLRTKELRLTAAASHRERNFHAAGRLIDDGTVRVDDLIHRRFPLSGVSAALEFATTNDTGRVLVTIGPELNGGPS